MKISRFAMPRTALALAMVSTVFAAPAMAQSFTDFESFTTGVSVDGQDGWRATSPNWDEEVVQLTGNRAWRVSNLVTSGSFGDQPFAKPSGLYAGETGSTHVYSGNAAVTNAFYASFDIWPVVNGPQTGLDLTISPDDGGGSRQSFLSIEDNGSGIDIEFYDTDGNHPTTDPNGGFRLTQVATGLSYGLHTIAIEITFVDGNVIDPDGTVHGNDIVNIYVDGNLVHTGTTWESYFWTTNEGQTPPTVRAVDTLLFRLSTPGFDGIDGGYYIDNVLIGEEPEAQQSLATFQVTKAYTDGNTDPVGVTLSCNGGQPLTQSFDIAPGSPVTFTVKDFVEGEVNCTVTETTGASGYTPSYDNGSTTSPGNCSWTGVTSGAYSCAITNSPADFDFVVDFEWDDTAAEATGTVDVSLYCTNVLNPDGSLDTTTRVSSGYQATATTDTSFEWLGVGAVNDDEDDDGPVNPTTCWAVASNVSDSALEVSGCEPFTVSPGDDEANCTMTASMFFEGIPTLSQYGMAIMALLMLGMGFVGFRRFV